MTFEKGRGTGYMKRRRAFNMDMWWAWQAARKPDEQTKILRAGIEETRKNLARIEELIAADMQLFNKHEVPVVPSRDSVIKLAHKLNPKAFESYSGKPRDFKRAVEVQRTEAIRAAEVKLGLRP